MNERILESHSAHTPLASLREAATLNSAKELHTLTGQALEPYQSSQCGDCCSPRTADWQGLETKCSQEASPTLPESPVLSAQYSAQHTAEGAK